MPGDVTTTTEQDTMCSGDPGDTKGPPSQLQGGGGGCPAASDTDPTEGTAAGLRGVGGSSGVGDRMGNQQPPVWREQATF